MVKALIFDCFGVLIGRGFDYTYRVAGGDPVKDKLFIEETLHKANMGLINDKQFQETIAEKLGLTRDEWLKVTIEAEMLNTELLDYIKELRAQYKTAF